MFDSDNDDDGYHIATIRGKPAVAVIVILLGLFIYSFATASRDVPRKVEENILSYLKARYADHSLSAEGETIRRGNRKEATAAAQRLLDNMEGIEITSISGRSVFPGNLYVRVEVEVNGAEPPDGHPVRCFKFTKGLGGDWVLEEEVYEFQYTVGF